VLKSSDLSELKLKIRMALEGGIEPLWAVNNGEGKGEIFINQMSIHFLDR
jgi:hypothetical protein